MAVLFLKDFWQLLNHPVNVEPVETFISHFLLEVISIFIVERQIEL